MRWRLGRRRLAGAVLMLLTMALAAWPPLRSLAALPDSIRLSAAEDLAHLDLHWPLAATAALSAGQSALQVRLFGLPLRSVSVQVVAQRRLVPGGHAIGVLLRSRGVLVVGHSAVRDLAGKLHHPGREAGVEAGDAILRIGGQAVYSEEQAGVLVERLGQSATPLPVEVNRRGRLQVLPVQPVQDGASGRWRLGLYVRDGAAGVGTLTFYDPASRRYGALGHVITEGSTGQPIEVREGSIVSATISGIDKGQPGLPGEKVGVFVNADRALGSIERNTRFGIFGMMKSVPANPFYPEPIPVGLAANVSEGPAEILTVTEGTRLERFQIRILRVIHTPQPDGKNLVIRITDPRLLSLTRGIVQGMSGSPIIQDGRLVGAVTHVFVGDPTRGYGVLVEQMLNEAGLLGPAA